MNEVRPDDMKRYGALNGDYAQRCLSCKERFVNNTTPTLYYPRCQPAVDTNKKEKRCTS